MKIYIPSKARATKKLTLRRLPEALHENCYIVVPKEEAPAYIAAGYGPWLLSTPKGVAGIGPTRHWILKTHASRDDSDKLIMLDDDLRFDIRRKDEPSKFFVATDKEILRLFKMVEERLDTYAHVGIMAREGGNRHPTINDRIATRMLRVLAYRPSIVLQEKIKYDRLPVMEDFDVTLELLRRGWPNCVITEFVNGQGGSNASGGCSTYRTAELQAEAAERLAALHHPFVKVVTKQTKTAWGWGERKDVVIQWAKAYASSQVR